MKSWLVQPFASNDLYICPDCGSEVRVGARRCPGCGPFQSMTPDHPAWQESSPNVQVNCMLAVPKEPDQPQKEAGRIRFATWFMLVLLGVTTLAGICAAFKLLLPNW